MIDQGFPQTKQSFFTGESGINLVSTIVNNDFKWILRVNHNETDFGIDAYIDIVSSGGYVTGQTIGIQIKSGESFFKTKTKNGFTFYGELKHLNYYMNSQIPIVIIICDESKRKCYWGDFDGNKIEGTKTGWKLNIRSNNIFNESSKNKLLNLLPPPKDYSDDLNEQWYINNLLKEYDSIIFTITKNDILSRNIQPICEFFDRLQVNDNLFSSLQGKVILSFYGYNDDRRELFEIKEIRRWFKKADSKITSWFFFLDTSHQAYGFYSYFTCLCQARVICKTKRMNAYEVVEYSQKGVELPALKVTFNMELVVGFIERNFLRLNEITDNLGMPLEKNKEISENIIKLIDFKV